MTKALLVLAVLVSWSGSVLAGGNVYWDPTNGTAAGTGSATPAATWGGNQWGDAAGTAVPAAWNNANGDTMVFAAGTDATGAYTVTVPAGTAITLAGIIREEGSPTFSDAAAGATPITFADGANLAIDSGTGTLIVNAFFGTTDGTITKSGTGILSPGTSQNAFKGKWVSNGGSLSFAGDLRIGILAGGAADEITLNNGAKLRSSTAAAVFDVGRGITLGNSGGGGFDQASTVTLTWNGPITGTSGGPLLQAGAGVTVLTNTSNNWDGATNISTGTLRVGASGVIPDASTVTLNGGNLDTQTFAETVGTVIVNGATSSILGSGVLTGTSYDVRSSNTTSTTGIQAPLGGAVALTKTTAGTVLLGNASNTYSGDTTITAGVLSVDTDASLGNGAGNVILNGGTLNSTGSRSGAGSIVLNPVQLAVNSSITCSGTAVSPIFEFSGALTGTAGLTLTFQDNAATATQFKPRFSGTFTFDSNIDMPTGSGTLAATTQLESFNSTGTTQTFTGTISGTGSYNRSASTPGSGGTTVFTGSNTYSGGTTVGRGTLLANNTSGSATGSGAVSIAGNGTLGGKGSVDGLVTVNNFGIVAPGNPGVNNGIDTLTLKGGLTLLEGGKLNFDLAAPGTNDKIDLLSSTLTLPLTSTPTPAFVNLTDVGGLAVGTYTLIDYGTNDPSGSLSNVTVAGPGGFNYSLFDNTGATTIELHVTTAVVGLPGDFNSDGKVDAGDYVTWRKAFDGSPTAPNAALANDNGLGTPITTAHYDLWRANFGNPPGAGSSGGGLGGAGVPEPSAIALLMIGLLAIGCRRRG